MIGRLTGKILECTPGQVVLDVTGVGYEVQIPLSTFYALLSGPGDTVDLRIHTHVREDALQLFGFASHEERAAFEVLIGTSGVGPRLALAILSGIGVPDLRTAVAQQDRARLQKIPGIGKKTAERLLLELRDRLNLGDAPPGAETAGPAAPAPGSDLVEDATSALVNLGYGEDVSRKAVERAVADSEAETPSLENVLRASLAGLIR
jgi:Holliday junction DNA helicase RuvA